MNHTAELQATLIALLEERFICPVANPELFKALGNKDFYASVERSLAPLGRTLSSIGDNDYPEAYFAALNSLDDKADRGKASAMLVDMRDSIGPCIEFFRLLDQAGGNDISLMVGGDLSYAKLLGAIEANDIYSDQLRNLSTCKLFESSRNAKDNAERLSKIIKVVQDQGYVIKRSADSTVYVFTGKLAYLQMILGWLADHHQIPIDTPEPTQQGSQEGLGL
jgi:hypothetical protein